MSGVESFKILLENSKEVYIPNEVVRGEVILVTKDVIRSRCICISFQSHTYMAWSIDDGDSKVTYTGSRFYRSLSYTMFGSVYKTGYLIGVYKNAIFGVENGEGLIHIPGHEDEDIPMVLQVMSQEGYKKERLLGHVCINLRDIISWKETRAYQITQPRNKEKAEIILSARLIPASALLLDNNCFIPYMSICELCVHQVIGLNTLMYGAKVKTWVQVFRTQSSILPYDQPPTKSSEAEECVLPAGTLTFPFAFHIRGDVPASAELGAGDESYIRHSLVASIDTQEGWWKDPYVRKVFTVLADRPLPPPNLLFPIRYRTPKPVSLADACSFCCLNYVGHVRADATLARQVLAPGELLPLRVLLNNDSNKVLTVRVDLYRHVTCRQTVMRDSVGKEFRTITPVYQSDVNPGEVWNFDGTLREVRVPAVFPSFLGTVDDPVTFAYSLVVYVRTPGFWGQGFRFSFAV